ncbi:HD-GYP domain, c-di-GMP phosphodiesterase class II (or its inactivated variant) [Nitrosomonas cryotolerans]|uniref:HD-GYP domain, c-di-GMP phosphodiesterase class II (Or its inactivated variant) n=1 Tax=Nitrosomonas cryotolerans ATCC 49181 TaxID=1131553 RepID=A0A1N6I7I2_9PROT|nr:HD-GYP domain-containing protein [Nitrosomonas cryotolerans]SFP97014.1 HD-GYP domain, c-di-GMP phosphodiesterase class II (or its inactivated variant) [Nitrosomonas cryotolerans]SIO27981.1 HD-GYP domain, c-di-GMP phosphodiesterase class II (or its inactivated variant) [Nitrosomonas cryotolerans ATCC 49181]
MTANATTLEIAVNDLQPGMYVSELDRPWLETPYLIQGILIQSQDDIDELVRYCTHVYVDTDKSEPFVISQHDVQTPPKTQGVEISRTSFHGTETYLDTCTAEEELSAATQAHDVAFSLIGEINVGIERNTKLDVRIAQDAVDALRESVIRNPDALLLLAQLKTTGRILYDNAINASVRLLAFGRQLGLPREELSILGLGGLLMDIGKLRLPSEILTSNRFLNATERNLMKQHVAYGEAIITQSCDIPEAVFKIIVQHHERENGGGYPRGLYANQLHAYARMAAIVDCYEELIGARPGIPAAKPFQALKELKDNSRGGLNPALVEQFSHCIGVFPVGSLVELNTGEVAIVLTHARSQRFLPRVMIILDAKKQPCDMPLTLDLKSAAPGAGGVPYAIASDLPQGAYGIDARQYYL